MISKLHHKAAAALAATLCLSAPAVGADGDAPVAPAAPAAAPAEEPDDNGLGAARYMPLGKPNREVKIPQFKDGVLECVMRAAEMTRVDEDTIDIKTMDIDFLEDGERSMNIEFVDATYSLGEKMIRSDKRTVIKRADFTLVGDSLDFDTASQQGRMIGKVRMVIHDSGGIRRDDAAAEGAVAETAGPASGAPAGGGPPWAGCVAAAIVDAMLEKRDGAPAGEVTRAGGGDE